MSAILQTDGALGPDGVRRYHTTCKVVINSHETEGAIDVSQEVIALEMSKNIKGTGNATVTLVASRNYLNLINPNDYINIYMDVGDGEGWTRTFFGFVDVVREKYAVAENGEPTTSYTLRCSDFQKAFDRTQIYFNPHMSGRADFGGDEFGAINIGGISMITKGVRTNGSPANIVQNLVMMLFGFGTQYILPPTYGPNADVIASNRNKRSEYFKGQLGSIARNALLKEETFKALRAATNAEASGFSSDLSTASPKKRMQALRDRYDLGLAEDDIRLANTGKFNKLVADAEFRKHIGAGSKEFNEHDPAILQGIGVIDDQKNYNLIDLIDAFTFFEEASIDGWVDDTGIWNKTGSLSQLLRNYTHDEVNEFYYDLRPVTEDNTSEDTEYLRKEDDINGNVGPSGVGIRYVPALVMREYPFGTISRIDGSDLRLRLPGDNKDDTALGIVEVGALFSDKPNVPGRHVVRQSTLSIRARKTGGNQDALRRIDVAVINSQEITSSDFARSDSDHFNLFEAYQTEFQLSDVKWTMSEILPIVTPIHVMRHGLRTRTYTTKWSMFNIDLSDDRTFGDRLDGIVTPAAPAEPEVSNGTSSEDSDLSLSGAAVAPVVVVDAADNSNRTGKVSSPYGWRAKNNAGVVRPVATVNASGGKWVFHNGVDINGDEGTDVLAVMDGVVVASVPNGVFGGYGESVLIKHKTALGAVLYTLYTHLNSRAVGQENVSPSRIVGMSSDVHPRGVFVPIPVTAGQVIGGMGRTNGTKGNPGGTFSAGSTHLHLEFLQKINNKVYPSKDKVATPDTDFPAGSNTPNPGTDNPRSLDPVAQLALLGVTLIDLSGNPAVSSDLEDADNNLDDDNDGFEENPAIDPGNAINADHLSGAASQIGESQSTGGDTIDTRKQILRWSLLQDHWYQHNLEYLSGQIHMRGAPEIRSGYRLDIEDRRMSFYVEGVSHSWQFPNKMTTTLTVSRGQSNNPYPMYVMPPSPAFVDNTPEQRSKSSRLSKFQVLADPVAVNRSIVFRSSREGMEFVAADDRTNVDAEEHYNVTDSPALEDSPNPDGTPVFDSVYGDYVLYPETDQTASDAAAMADVFAEFDELFGGVDVSEALAAFDSDVDGQDLGE